MHTEKLIIFDKYAHTLGLSEITDFEDILSSFKTGGFSFPEFLDVIFEACDLVQKAQQERIAEGISKCEFKKGHYVDTSSILSENNLIK